MGFLEDIGRTNAASHVGSELLRGAQGLARMQIGGSQQGFENTIALQREQANQELRTRQAQEYLKQKEAYERPMNVTLNPAFRMLPEDLRSEALKDMQGQGLVDDRGIGQTGKIKEFVGQIENTAPLFQKYMGRMIQARREEVGKLADKFNKETDPAKKEQLKQEYMGSLQSLMASEGTYQERLELLKQMENKKKAYSTVKTKEGVFSFNPETGTLGTRLGGLPPEAATNPQTADWHNKTAFTNQYNAQRSSLTNRALQVTKKYGLTADEAMKVAEGDASIVTQKMPDPAIRNKFFQEMKEIDDQFRELDTRYNEGISTGKYSWGKREKQPTTNDPLGLR